MTGLTQDVRRVLRQLARQPVFTLAAVVTLAIGIGVNAVAFTVVNGLLLKSPPGAMGAAAGRIETTPAAEEGGYLSLEEFRRVAEASAGALDVAAEGRLTLAWRHDGATDVAWVLFVSRNYFPLVQAPALAGRIHVAAARSGTASVVIGERFWRRRLHTAPLGGLTLRLNDIDVNVAGVVPESFRGPAGLYAPDVWVPLEDLALFRTSPLLQKPDSRWLFAFGRMHPGADAPTVRGRLDAAAAAMTRDLPDSHAGRGLRFALFSENSGEVRGVQKAVVIAMSIIALVLLLACFNTANLLLARATEGERDIAIRAAIGAGPSRLVRLVALEGFAIAVLAGGAALVIAWWTQSLVGSFAIPIDTPQYIDLSPDRRVIGFVGALVFVAAVLPGLWPAARVARIDVLRVLGSQGTASASGRPSRLRGWLVGAQIAGSTAFLAIAALLIQSFGALSDADLGFERDRLLVAEVEPAAHGYPADRAGDYVDTLADRVRAQPGVASVAVADRVPFFVGYATQTPVSRPESACDAESCPQVPTHAVTSGYFETMGIPLVAGREFERGNETSAAIVNQPLARQLWPDGGALGRSIRVPGRASHLMVVGVTAKTHTRGLDREAPALFLPFTDDHYGGPVTIVARTLAAPESLAGAFAAAARSLDPRVPAPAVKTMRERMAVQLWPFRTVSWLFSICGVLALLLSTAGLAGVVMHAVRRRYREFGVRIAIGATRQRLIADVLRGSSRLLLPGVVGGTLIAATAARLLRFAFVGVDVLDPRTYLAVALFESLVVVLACAWPAWKAARVDPLVVLRAD